MRRTARIYLNDLNARSQRLPGHDVTQYAVDVLATSGLQQPASKPSTASATVSASRPGLLRRSPSRRKKSLSQGKRFQSQVRRHTVTLYSHFVSLPPGPLRSCCRSDRLRCAQLDSSFPQSRLIRSRSRLDNTLRLGRTGKRLWLEVILVMERPKPYRGSARASSAWIPTISGFVFSDEHVGQDIYDRLARNTLSRRFPKARPFTRSIARLDVLVLERLKYVKTGRRGTSLVASTGVCALQSL